jgi:transposase
MPKVMEIKLSRTPVELRRLAAATKNANQSRRLLSLAAVLDGKSRAGAAKIGGMDRQTLRDGVHRYNEQGPDGLRNSYRKGNPMHAARRGEA